MRWSLPVWLFVLCAMLASCGLFSSPSTPTSEPIEIVFAYPSQLLAPHFESLEESFEAAHPNINIVLQNTNPYRAISGSASSSADVAMIDQLVVAVYAEAGEVLDLDQLLQGSPEFSREAFFEGTIDALTWQGKLWALPADVDPWVLYYNKDLFDAANVSYPTPSWTWDDMLDAAQRLTDLTASPPVYGLGSDLGRADFVPLVYQNGGTLVDSLVDPTTVTFTDMATVEALDWYLSLALGYGVMPTPAELSSMGGFENAVTSQRFAMWYGPFSERNGTLWGITWPFSWGMAPEPGNRERMTLISMRCYVISASSEHPAQSWQWLEYLAMNPPVSLAIPPLQAALESDAFRASYSPEVYQTALESLRIGSTIPPVTWIDNIGAWLVEAIQSAFSEDIAIEEALNRVQERAEPLLSGQGR